MLSYSIQSRTQSLGLYSVITLVLQELKIYSFWFAAGTPKNDRNKGSKMFCAKASSDVGMVLWSSSCMEKPTSGKCIGTRRGVPWHSNNPGQICQLQGTLDMYFINPYIWQHFQLSQYDTAYWEMWMKLCKHLQLLYVGFTGGQEQFFTILSQCEVSAWQFYKETAETSIFS